MYVQPLQVSKFEQTFSEFCYLIISKITILQLFELTNLIRDLIKEIVVNQQLFQTCEIFYFRGQFSDHIVTKFENF